MVKIHCLKFLFSDQSKFGVLVHVGIEGGLGLLRFVHIGKREAQGVVEG